MSSPSMKAVFSHTIEHEHDTLIITVSSGMPSQGFSERSRILRVSSEVFLPMSKSLAGMATVLLLSFFMTSSSTCHPGGGLSRHVVQCEHRTEQGPAEEVVIKSDKQTYVYSKIFNPP